jgi:hypothetical protein
METIDAAFQAIFQQQSPDLRPAQPSGATESFAAGIPRGGSPKALSLPVVVTSCCYQLLLPLLLP